VVTLSGTGVDFALPASNTGLGQAVVQGASAQYSISVAPVAGTYSNPVTLTCSGLPAQAACSFATNPVTPGASGATSALTISTAAPVYAHMLPPSTKLPPTSLPALLLGAMLLTMVGWWQVRRTRPRWAAATCLLFGLLFATLFMAGCGAGGFPLPKVGGTPVGSYPVTVTGTSGSTSHSTTVTLTVTAS
jgi:peptidoglycan/LPS O-acetylase OafA/YrhL